MKNNFKKLIVFSFVVSLFLIFPSTDPAHGSCIKGTECLEIPANGGSVEYTRNNMCKILINNHLTNNAFIGIKNITPINEWSIFLENRPTYIDVINGCGFCSNPQDYGKNGVLGGDHVFCDNKGFLWSIAYSDNPSPNHSGFTLFESMNLCNELVYSISSNWHLPTWNQLRNDYGVSACGWPNQSNTGSCNSCSDCRYKWDYNLNLAGSAIRVWSSDHYWYVNFSNGAVTLGSNTQRYSFRCRSENINSVSVVTYNGNSGSCSPGTRKVANGDSSGSVSCSRSNHVISSYSITNGSCAGSFNSSTGVCSRVMEDITITANWVRTYTVKFDTSSSGGCCQPDRTVVSGGTASAPTKCCRTNYTWSSPRFSIVSGSGCGNLNTSTGAVTNVTCNMTIRPHFRRSIGSNVGCWGC